MTWIIVASNRYGRASMKRRPYCIAGHLYCLLLGTPKRSGRKAVCVCSPLSRSDFAEFTDWSGATAEKIARQPAMTVARTISWVLRFIWNSPSFKGKQGSARSFRLGPARVSAVSGSKGRECLADDYAL